MSCCCGNTDDRRYITVIEAESGRTLGLQRCPECNELVVRRGRQVVCTSPLCVWRYTP
jgi:hypothetical protein